MKKLNSLLLLTAIVPTLTMSLTAIATPIGQHIALAQQTQANEVIDFGTRAVNARPTSLPLNFTLPAGQSLFKITPTNSPPFTVIDPNPGAAVGVGARDITLQVKHAGGAVGVHNQTIEIRSTDRLIKKVVLKVKIVPVPSTNAVDGSNNQTQPNNGQNSISDRPPTGGFGSPNSGNRP